MELYSIRDSSSYENYLGDYLGKEEFSLLDDIIASALYARLPWGLNSLSHSSIVFGSGFPAVSGNIRESNDDNNALTPNSIVGIAI